MSNRVRGEQAKQITMLDPSPYNTMIERADAQGWRNGFGALQMRCKDLQQMVATQASMLFDLTLKVESLTTTIQTMNRVSDAFEERDTIDE